MNTEQEEIWRPVPGSNCVEASNLGRIRQFGRVMEQVRYKGNPYLRVKGCEQWGNTPKDVHRLVALAWLTLPDDADNVKYDINHIDEQKTNNCASNLAYMTEHDHAIMHTKGKPRSAEARANIGKANSKPIQQFTLGEQLIATFQSLTEASCCTGINCGRICQCCKGKLESAGGFVWRYVTESIVLSLSPSVAGKRRTTILC